MEIEVKALSDDVVRGIGQLAEASAFGYHQVILVTTLRKAWKIDQPLTWGSFLYV